MKVKRGEKMGKIEALSGALSCATYVGMHNAFEK
jgi:hypothetical protein